MSAIINKYAKWRQVFAAWQLGTRGALDGECRAVKDHREVTMLLRAEVNALTALLVQKGVFTSLEMSAQVEVEAERLDQLYESKFPGFRTTDNGIALDPAKASATMQRMGFPQ